ncbi:MAG: TrmH family RNA methyltransferase [Holophagae bacterium]|jgi:tRNA G18 (ribose-2'-O)-methylase SpoU
MTTKHEYAAARRAERRARRLAEYRRGLRPFAVAAWEISKEHNVGTLVRTAHAAAASEVILIGEKEWNVEAARTAQNYTEIVRLPAEPDALLRRVVDHGYDLVAVELAAGSTNLFDAVYPERPCFLLGAELGGLPQSLLDAARLIVQIPQWGLVPCLNLAVAGSIVIYDFLGKRHLGGHLDRPDGGLVAPGETETVVGNRTASGTSAGERGHTRGEPKAEQ